MPEISRFYGIIIFMNYNDHNPPHFHAKYQDYEILIYIHTGEIIGNISRQGLKLIYLWLDENKEALLENWELAKLHKNLKTIKPLL
jgi:hypothetical protein